MAKKRRHVQPLMIDKILKLKKYILKKLEKKCSPDVTAAKSKAEINCKISAETIYQYCYNEKNKKLKWFLLLASMRKKKAANSCAQAKKIAYSRESINL